MGAPVSRHFQHARLVPSHCEALRAIVDSWLRERVAVYLQAPEFKRGPFVAPIRAGMAPLRSHEKKGLRYQCCLRRSVAAGSTASVWALARAGLQS
eukprot:9503532-Pyramimonas_sp.AAC.1